MSTALVNRSDEDVELKHTNQLRNQEFMKRMQCFTDTEKMKNIPPELLLSLMIGATESYCRAWLSHSEKLHLKPIKKYWQIQRGTILLIFLNNLKSRSR